MPGKPEQQEDEDWFRPPWETEVDADLDPPSPPRARRIAPEPDYAHPLLQPLARAQELLTRLETRAELASPAIAEGLRARLSYREAAGWLAHAHVWIHPHDLALRDRGLTSSYGAAFRAGRLNTEIPATTAQSGEFEEPPSDILVGQALQLARLWRRLAEMATWRPLANSETVRETLQSLGCGSATVAEIDEWVAVIGQQRGPLLVRAGLAARDWLNRPANGEHGPAGIFLAACLCCGNGQPPPIPLPLWSAPELHHHRLERHTGLEWLVDFLDCVAAAAQIGLGELERLRQAEEKSRSLGRTARSRLQDAIAAVLRTPIVTTRDLADTLGVTSQAALGLLRQLVEAGVIREATGRVSWRAFILRS